MADLIEISELPNESSSSSSNKSIFGSGIELLMNDKVKEKKHSNSDVHLDDLNNLENELNELVMDDFPTNTPVTNSFVPKSDFFSEKPSVTFKDDLNSSSNTNFNTNNEDNTKTWDGFDKFNNIPLNPDKQAPSGPQMTKEELLREKFRYLKKLESGKYVDGFCKWY